MLAHIMVSAGEVVSVGGAGRVDDADAGGQIATMHQAQLGHSAENGIGLAKQDYLSKAFIANDVSSFQHSIIVSLGQNNGFVQFGCLLA